MRPTFRWASTTELEAEKSAHRSLRPFLVMVRLRLQTKTASMHIQHRHITGGIFHELAIFFWLCDFTFSCAHIAQPTPMSYPLPLDRLQRGFSEITPSRSFAIAEQSTFIPSNNAPATPSSRSGKNVSPLTHIVDSLISRVLKLSLLNCGMEGNRGCAQDARIFSTFFNASIVLKLTCSFLERHRWISYCIPDCV